MNPWLARLRHDLLKPALWCVRDLRDSGRLDGATPLDAADRRALRRSLLELHDSEGRRVPATGLWRELRADSDAAARPLDAFEAAVTAAEAAAVADLAQGSQEAVGRPSPLLAAVLRLESAFLLLAQEIDR